METPLTYNPRTNGKAKTKFAPVTVSNDAECRAALAILVGYFERMKGDESKLTKEEHEHFRRIAEAIEAFEDEHYPLPTQQEALLLGFSIGVWDAAALKAFRKEYDLTQANVAEFLGVSQARVAEMERGKHEFSQTTRIALDRVKHYIISALSR